MEAAVELIKDALLYLFVAAFLLGFLLRLLAASSRALHYGLAVLALLFGAGIVIGLVLSGGMLIFLLFQLLIFLLVLLFTVFAGGLCGSGLLRLLQLQAGRKLIDEGEWTQYLALEEFAALEDTEPARVLARIKSGYYRGGRRGGQWYVHRDELTPKAD